VSYKEEDTCVKDVKEAMHRRDPEGKGSCVMYTLGTL